MVDGSKDKEIEATKRLMGALVRQPPKPHDEMKIGKRRREPPKKQTKKKVAKPGHT
jgi:hypothetical protein